MSERRKRRPLALQIAPADSVFPAILAHHWQERGFDVAIVSRRPRPFYLPESVRVVHVPEPQNFWVRKGWNRVGHRIEQFERWIVRKWAPRFARATGREFPEGWERQHFTLWLDALDLAKAARALRPTFVFGHEAAAYGLATSLCRDVPRILFPWGGDVFSCAETWPGAYWVIRQVLRSADLIVPSSVTGAKHVVERFAVPANRVQPISWGVDPQRLQRADAEKKKAICAQWQMPADRLLIFNCRRFAPQWGCHQAVLAFIEAARRLPDAHFVLLGGPAESIAPHVEASRRQINAAGLSDRFTLIDHAIPFEAYEGLLTVVDVSVSLQGRGDMRSGSVVQAAGAGTALVLADNPEYRLMEQDGLCALFVEPSDIEAVAAAVIRYAREPALRQMTRDANRKYIAEYENHTTQMDRMLAHIEAAVYRFRRRRRLVAPLHWPAATSLKSAAS